MLVWSLPCDILLSNESLCYDELDGMGIFFLAFDVLFVALNPK